MDPTKPTSCKVFRSCLVVRLRSVTTFVSWFSIAIVVVQAIFQHRRATSGWFDCPHRHPPITTDILRPSPTLNMAAIAASNAAIFDPFWSFFGQLAPEHHRSTPPTRYPVILYRLRSGAAMATSPWAFSCDVYQRPIWCLSTRIAISCPPTHAHSTRPCLSPPNQPSPPFYSTRTELNWPDSIWFSPVD